MWVLGHSYADVGCQNEGVLSLTDIWPPYGVRIQASDLSLTTVRDSDIAGLVELALSGIHPPEVMPFAAPWTDADSAELPANMVRFFSAVRSALTPDRFTLNFAVRVGGELVGVQDFTAKDFAVTRSGETGSWLGQRFQGRGIGIRMRRAVCAFAFDGLGAMEVTSGAFVDNPASLAVSRKVGYRENGVVRMKRRANDAALQQKLVLTPGAFIRGEPIQLDGIAPLRTFLGLSED